MRENQLQCIVLCNIRLLFINASHVCLVKLVTSGVLLAEFGLWSRSGAWVTYLACHSWLFYDTTECVWLAGHVSHVCSPWNSHHSGRMFSIPQPHTPAHSERRSSLAHHSLTKGWGLSVGGHQRLLRCSLVPIVCVFLFVFDHMCTIICLIVKLEYSTFLGLEAYEKKR